MPAIDREGYGSRGRKSEDVAPTSITFWFKRISHFRLLSITIFNADLHMFTIPTVWHLSGLWLPEGQPLTIDTPHLTVLRYVVRVALYSDA